MVLFSRHTEVMLNESKKLVQFEFTSTERRARGKKTVDVNIIIYIKV